MALNSHHDAQAQSLHMRTPISFQGQEVQIHWEETGDGPQTVIFIHGIPTSSYLWRHVVRRLGPDVRAIALDLVGYGASDKDISIDIGIDAQATMVALFLEKLGIKRAILCGHDIGGGVVQLVSLNRPALIQALVLVDAILYDSFPEPTIARMTSTEWDDRIHQVDLRRGFRRALEAGACLGSEELDRLADHYATIWDGKDGRSAYLRAARSLRTEELAGRSIEVERLPFPIEVVWGEDDPFQNVSFGRRLAAANSNVHLRVVPGARHFLPEDVPNEVVSAIDRAIARTGCPIDRSS